MINHKQSIDALRKIKKSNNDLSPPKQFKQNKLRSDFKSSLSKLITTQTKEQGMKELKNLIVQNKTSLNLRIWLSVLNQNRQKSHERQALIIGFIINQYGKHLIDPLDKIPSIEKTIFRIIQLLKRFFKNDVLSIQMACQKAWLEMYKSCLFEQPLEIKKRLIYDTLEIMINGGVDKQSQITAQIIIDGLLEVSLIKEDNQFFREIAKPTLILFLKTYIVHPATLTSLQTILSFFKLSNLQPIAESIINKIVYYIENAPLNSLGYKMRSEGCNLLGMFGEEQVVRFDLQGIIVGQLEAMATDKVWAVQNSARKALDIWKKKKNELSRVEEEKKTKVRDFDELKYSVQSLFLESKDKERFNQGKSKIKVENNYVLIDKQKQKSFQKDNQQQRIEYLKKGQGSGGGYFHQPLNQQKFNYQPEHKKIQEIKNRISSTQYKAQSQIVDFQQTVPYENQVIRNLKSETAPQNFNKIKTFKQANSKPAPQAPEIDSDEQALLDNWEKVLILAQTEQFEAAYKLILEMDDDIYLIRLLIKTGPILDKLTRSTSTRLLKKLLQIMKSDFINQLFMSTVQSAIQNNVTSILDNKQNKTIVDIMSGIEKNEKYEKHIKRLKESHENSFLNTK